MTANTHKTVPVWIVGLLTVLVTFIGSGFFMPDDPSKGIRLGKEDWFGVVLETYQFQGLLSFVVSLVTTIIATRKPVTMPSIGSLLNRFKTKATDIIDDPVKTPFKAADTLFGLARDFAIEGDSRRSEEMCDAATSIVTEVAEANEPKKGK